MSIVDKLGKKNALKEATRPTGVQMIQMRISNTSTIRREQRRRVYHVSEGSGTAKWMLEDIQFVYDATGYVKLPDSDKAQLVCRDVANSKWIYVDPNSVEEA